MKKLSLLFLAFIVDKSCATQFVDSDNGLRYWKNSEIELVRTSVPENGLPLVLGCKHKVEYDRYSCVFWSPPDSTGNMQRFEVVDGLVLDELDNVVDWVEVWEDDDDITQSTCGIKILEKTSDHDDSDGPATKDNGWKCEMSFTQGGMFGITGVLGEIHLKEELLTHLPPGFVAKHYDLSFTPSLNSSDPLTSLFAGTSKITLDTKLNNSTHIPLHSDSLEITWLAGSSSFEQDIIFSGILFDFQKSLIHLISRAQHSIGDEIMVEIHFYSKAERGAYYQYGFYKEQCSDYQDKFCWFTQLAMTNARNAFPCQDEPSYKATFDISIDRSDDYISLANMPLVSSVPATDRKGWFLDKFSTSYEMSTYLLAWAVVDFVGEGDGRVQVWTDMASIEEGLTHYAKTIGPVLVDFYEEYLMVDYTLPKLDLLSVPGKYGAMENWGLIAFPRRNLLLNVGNHSLEEKFDVIEVVAHEIAHQWFGDLVTLEWWDQTWLNEGLATFMSYKAMTAVDQSFDSWGWFVASSMMSVMKEDSLNTSWSLSDPVTSRDDIYRKFGHITYNKGASLLRMMESVLGLDAMALGLSNYINSFQFGNVREDDLLLSLEEAGYELGTWPNGGKDSFVEVMKKWTNQKGYPLVTVTAEQKGSNQKMILEQTWYHQDEGGQLWDIPVTITEVRTSGTNWNKITPDYWLSEKTGTIDLEPHEDTKAILLNTRAVGYYRVNYSYHGWYNLGLVLSADHEVVDPYNRAQIICDVISLVETGLMEQGLREHVLQFLSRETDLTPLMALEVCSDSLRKTNIVNFPK